MALSNSETAYELDLDQPKMYKVILHNDDYTAMDFVVAILMELFHKSRQDAEFIMLQVHQKGKAVVGVYTYEIATTKAQHVKRRAKEAGYPLLATVEEDS